MDFRHYGDDEPLRPLDLTLLDILDHSMKPVFIMIFLDEEELIFLALEHLPARRELEEDRIERELETILPLLDLGVVGSLPIERIESSTRLIVSDDERVIGESLDAVDLSRELDGRELLYKGAGAKRLRIFF